ncbi:MAG TPA: cytochrome c [Phaeodactylibacter sp.]|nr:cytochrome c [Phaeodactylibacter sp.]
MNFQYFLSFSVLLFFFLFFQWSILIPSKQVPPFSEKKMQIAKAIIERTANVDFQKIDASALYKQKCISCHGPEGNLQMYNAPDLSQSDINLELAVAYLYHGKRMMPSFNKKMTEAEIVAMAHYIEKAFK